MEFHLEEKNVRLLKKFLRDMQRGTLLHIYKENAKRGCAPAQPLF